MFASLYLISLATVGVSRSAPGANDAMYAMLACTCAAPASRSRNRTSGSGSSALTRRGADWCDGPLGPARLEAAERAGGGGGGGAMAEAALARAGARLGGVTVMECAAVTASTE